MARLLWPVLLLVLVVAVAGPCLTFYLLIKDYWAEVSSLRRDLLFCQLASTDLKFDIDLDNFPTLPRADYDAGLPMPPAPLPLVATTTPSPFVASLPSLPSPASSPSPLSGLGTKLMPDLSAIPLPDIHSTTTTHPSTTASTTAQTTSTSSTHQPSKSPKHPTQLSEITDAESVLGTQTFSPPPAITRVPNLATSRRTSTIPSTKRPAAFRRNTLPPLNRLPPQAPRTISSRRPQLQPPTSRSPHQTPTTPRASPPSTHTSKPPLHAPSTFRPHHTTTPRTSHPLTSKPPGPSAFQGRARGRPWVSGVGRRGPIPSRPFRSLDTIMVADESSDREMSDTAAANMEYVSMLERQLRDMQARVNACRLCLAPPQRNLPMCGGGAAWKEHRRRNKQLRRKQRRERKRKKKEQSSTSSTTDVPTTTTTTTTTTTPPPDMSYMSDIWRSESDATKKDNARARETHRMSTDFRRGFNQKIVRMDDALMQFTDTQAKFCKELRDNLGGRLEKRGQELEALSDQIAALVRASTAQIAALEKLASDQMYSGQTSIEKNLAVTQAVRDSQLRGIQNYHKQTFLPAAAAIATVLSEQASSATSMGVALITKVEMLQDVYITYATQQADTLMKLEQEVDMFASKHNNLLMRSKDHAKHLHINTETFIRELQSRMNNVVKELVLIRLQSQNYVSLSNDTYNNISGSLNKTQSAVDNLSQGVRQHIVHAKEREQDFKKIFKLETNQMSDGVENGVSRALVFNHAVMRQIEETELDTRVFVGHAVAGWNEYYVNQESELRIEADALTSNLQSHTHHTQNILSGLRNAAETHEQVLEEQRMGFQQFIRKRQDALDTQCSAITDWAMLMSTELRRRDQDLHRFLSEDLQYTTVSVYGGGYLVSQLPDNTLEYESSPAHGRASQPPPNVPYQLDEIAYSTSSASPTSHHSSRNKPQLEKTVVSVNTSSKSSSANNKVLNNGSVVTSSSNSVNLNKGITSTDINSRYNSIRNNNESLKKDERNISVVTELHSVISNEDNEITHHFDIELKTKNTSIDQHSKLPEEQELELNVHNNSDMMNNEIEEKEHQVEVKSTREEEVVDQSMDTGSDEMGSGLISETLVTSPFDLFFKSKKVLFSNINRQNDGAYKPGCISGCKARSAFSGSAFSGKGGQKRVGLTPNVNFEDSTDDDEGIKNLRKILRDAQLTIKKFQIDFQTDNSYRKNITFPDSWEDDSESKLGTTDHFKSSINSTNTADIVMSHTSSSSKEGNNHTMTHHKTRHHHGEGHRRKDKTPSVLEDSHHQTSTSNFLYSLSLSSEGDNAMMEELHEIPNSSNETQPSFDQVPSILNEDTKEKNNITDEKIYETSVTQDGSILFPEIQKATLSDSDREHDAESIKSLRDDNETSTISSIQENGNSRKP